MLPIYYISQVPDSSEYPPIIIFDLEATCWKSGNKDKMQAIEFGAVQLDQCTLKIVSEFQRFVRPTLEPVLSEFCKELTGIKQEDVNDAEPFAQGVEQ